jgi:endonuclease/exonuclease/phosphatase family metal-dependent hydrolase
MAVPPAHALRIVNYNIMVYPNVDVSGRNPHFRAVMAPVSPDIVVVQEMNTAAGVDSFRINVLNVLEPGQWSSAPFINGNDSDNAFFYKASKVAFLGQWAWYPNPLTNLRLVNCYRVKPAGYSAGSAELRIYSQHLKAGTAAQDKTDRRNEAAGIRDSMNAMPPGTHAILMGDFNLYTSAELAYQKLLESQADNDGRLYDPFNLLNQTQAWHDDGSFSLIHTQSPCLACPSGSYATGGLDDRFDLFLPTYNMNNGEGLELLVSTYKTVGNDGQHLNKNITDSPTIPEGAAYANSLWMASDHMPIRTDIQLPARIGVPASLALGTVIVAGSADLPVTNPAVAPADHLTYSFVAPAGFTAPGGTFNLNAGVPAALHAIGTAPGPAGSRAGTLIINTNDPDYATRPVSLTVTVLDHAAASLDSIALLTAGILDFGTHPEDGFSNQSVRVHNLGYDALHARLSLDAANIAGGAGRFSIAGGFSPALIAGVGRSYEIAFDPAGATPDSTYEAALTFTSTDEPLPGAQARPDLNVTLSARVQSGPLAAGAAAAPQFTRLYPPFPNPLEGASTVHFDLARATAARLEIFDLSGRRVTVLADRVFEPGRYALRWAGREATGAAAAPGLYFVRLSGAGVQTQTARLVVVH